MIDDVQIPELGNFLAPLDLDTFVRDYFEREVLHLRGGRRHEAFKRLDAFQLIEESCRGWGDFSLARADVEAAGCPYLGEEPVADTALRAFADGYTIVINDLQAKNDSAAAFCRMFESAFFCRGNVNLYLSPGGAAGLRCHYDDDDVFILQVRGRKRWLTYPHKDRLPLGSEDYRADTSWGIAAERIVEPGDLLYLPRGTPHEAVAMDEESLHITASLNVLRWVELVVEAIRASAFSRVELRRAVPLELLRGALPLSPDRLPKVLMSLALDDETIRTGLQRVQTKLLAGAERLLATGNPTAEIEADTRLRIAPDHIWCSAASDQGIVIQAVGLRLEFPLEMQSLTEALVSRREIVAGDLLPLFSIERRLEMARNLVECGFLIPCKPATAVEDGPARDGATRDGATASADIAAAFHRQASAARAAGSEA